MHFVWFANLFGIVLIGGVLLLERSPLAYGNLPFPVLNSPVKAGEAIHLRVRRCNNDDRVRVYDVSRVLVGADGGQFILTPLKITIDPKCETVVSKINIIPADTPPGKYTLRGYGEINGFIRTHMVQWQSVEFVVTP